MPGGNGYINDYPTGRLLRDAKLYEIGAGTSEIRRMLIGRELLPKPPNPEDPEWRPVEYADPLAPFVLQSFLSVSSDDAKANRTVCRHIWTELRPLPTS